MLEESSCPTLEYESLTAKMISSIKQRLVSDSNVLDQLAGITGIGWTVSILGYVSAAIGYGTVFISRLVTDPQSLLYLGGVLFMTTLGLDRLRDRRSKSER